MGSTSWLHLFRANYEGQRRAGKRSYTAYRRKEAQLKQDVIPYGGSTGQERESRVVLVGKNPTYWRVF